MKTMKIFLNGKIVSVNDDFVDRIKPGVLDVPGVFETMLVYNGNIFNLSNHLKRFKRGLKVFKIRLPYSEKKIIQALQKIIRQNNIKHGRIRLSAFKDKNVTVAIVAKSVKKKSQADYERGYKAYVSSVVRNPKRYSHVKSHYWNLFYIALLEARAHKYDEAILLNKNKEIVEGSVSNLFFIKNKTLMTPTISSGCLNGVTRNTVISLAQEAGYKVKRGRFKLKSMMGAEEVFMTNSILPIMPIVRIDGQKIGSGRMGPQTAALLKSYQKKIISEI